MNPATPASWLLSVEAFRSLGASQARRLLSRCYTQNIETGETLTLAGATADALHVVISGRFAASGAAGAPSHECGLGAVFGDPHFFWQGVFPFTLRAMRDSLVLTLEWDEFAALADGEPEFWRAATGYFARACGASAAPAAAPFAPPQTLTVLPAGAAPLEPRIVDALAAAFEPLADAQYLTPASFGQNLPGGFSLADPEVMHWMREQQQRFGLVIRVADGSADAWARAAIAEADAILLVAADSGARGGGAFDLNPSERLAFAALGPQACRLVAVRGAGPYAGAGSLWGPARPVKHAHFVRDGGFEDYARLARLVLGRSAGYIACGGGLYSAAHLGVAQALAEAGCRIDAWGGVGAGAAAAALMALGIGPREAAQFFPLPRSRDGLARLLASAFDDVPIEALPLPFRALSACLRRATPRVHHSGPALGALLANWPPPGASPPYIEPGGGALADGSLIDPAPDWLLQDAHDGANVIVRLTPPASPLEEAAPGGWASRPFGGARPPPPGQPDEIAHAVMRVISLRLGARTPRPCDLHLSPPLSGARPETALEHAYDWTRKELDRLIAEGHPAAVALLRSPGQV